MLSSCRGTDEGAQDPGCCEPILTGLRRRKYPQFQQDEIFSLQDAFRKLDVDDKGYIDEATAIKATQSSERQPYDVVRQALKEVELDSSRRVELDDYVGVSWSRDRPA
jgi:Ca2+-binding EF-hand superfamily protein